ncbi:MAG: TlyA family RNA methyltransferase [Clostridia bacterium]|jgi:23S rRNA (cytidine1920-2'-O)/16S rRNA (cytidine1409-2'-O)-methyltransferase|nr:TlyA family RNA methyltransferase [Clostridia bacterium]MDD4502287.1 TlyA family RNA methyltransferase [Clostridia bacterium]NLV33440.1 TlyA family RNA methyltransferase [Clostridiaceae bacterium]
MKRLDTALFEKSMARSRTNAQQIIEKGFVRVNNRVILKPSYPVDLGKDNIESDYHEKYVSRGAYKLLQAFDVFKINIEGMTVLDAGASTGGFTQVLLEKGANKVYSVDVGSNQMDASVKSDSRVLCMENTDIRNIDMYIQDNYFEFATCDLSFISIDKTSSSIYKVMKKGAKAVFLIKPQFEAGKQNIGKKGIVKDEQIRKNCVENIKNHLTSIGFKYLGLTECVLKGGSGNTEYLIYIEKA